MKKKTLVLQTDLEDLARAAAIIKAGGLVVFPTETVYGLGANALDAGACAGIFRAKGRPQDNPLIVHLASPHEIRSVAEVDSPEAAVLVERFLPGPLTLVLPKKPLIPDEVTAGLPTVGIRIPESETARNLIALAGVPVAAPSANISGRPSPTTFEMAWEAMNGRADAVIRGDDCDVGIESTIVRVEDGRIVVLRPGKTAEEDIREALRTVPVLSSAEAKEGERPRAPGMKYVHYKPRAEVVLFTDPASAAREMERHPESKYGVLALRPIPAGAASVRLMADLADYARRLYSEFFMFDRLGCDRILAELPAPGGIGHALRNRLMKASGGDILPTD